MILRLLSGDTYHRLPKLSSNSRKVFIVIKVQTASNMVKMSMLRVVFLSILTFFAMGMARNVHAQCQIAFDSPAGTLDSCFSAQSGPRIQGYVQGMALRANGRLLLSGQYQRGTAFEPRSLIQLEENGDIDTSFYLGPEFLANGNYILLQQDDRILLSQSLAYRGVNYDLIRLLPDGHFDSTFVPSPSVGAVTGFRLQQDEKIIVNRRNVPSRLRVVRYLSDGRRDMSFQPDSVLMKNAEAVACQADGKIFLVCSSPYDPDFSLVRVHPDGSLDTSFHAYSGLIRATAMAVQEDGKYVVGGTMLQGAREMYVLMRLLEDGRRDQSFTPLFLGIYANDIVLLPNGKIVVAGDRSGVPATIGVLCDVNGMFITNFNLPSSPNGISAAWKVVLTSDNKAVFRGYFNRNPNTPYSGVVRFFTQFDATEVAEEVKKDVMNTYPVPASEKMLVRIDKPVRDIWLCTVDGRRVAVSTAGTSGRQEIELLTTDVPSGLYTLLVEFGDGSRNQRRIQIVH